MSTCVVPNCNMDGTKNPEKLSLHTCPVKKARRELWYALIPNAKNWNTNSRICSKHFTEDSFQENSQHTRKDKQRKLKPYAIPSLFLGSEATDLAACKDQKGTPRHVQIMKLAKCGWLERALAKKSIKPSILKPKTAKVPLEKEPTCNSTVTDDMEQNTDNIITEFECPYCLKMFRMYFSAHRHIEKLHCSNNKGKDGSLKNGGAAKPTLVEYCLTCNTRVCSESHKCSIVHRQTQNSTRQFKCLGCEQQFHTLHLFEVHIEKQHSDKVEKYFFPDISDFTLWKQNMEMTTNVKYLAITRREKLRNYYCMHVTCDSNTVCLCPSSIIAERYINEVHVTFYTQHYGHVCNKYTMPDQFEECAIMDHSVPDTQTCEAINEESTERFGDETDSAVAVEDNTRVNSRRKPAHTVRVEETAAPNISGPSVQTQTSVDDLYVDIVDENLELMSEMVPRKRRRTRKQRVKTKIGFKSINRKRIGLKSINRKHIGLKSITGKVKGKSKGNIIEVKPDKKSTFLPKVKVDFKYEVHERDNDCNVLILKVD